MKIIISPAKKLSENCKKRNFDFSEIIFKKEAKKLVDVLKDFNVKELANIMNISENLSEININRFKKWKSPFNGNSDYAIFMFKGDVYKGLDVESLNHENILYAQENLRILSGLYGVLKPLDKILPYRLEMGTKLETQNGKNLYEYWGNSISDHIKNEMSSNEILVNLASDEYSKVVNLKRFERKVIVPKFLDEKNGRLKVISFYAKKARGMMARYIIQNKPKKGEDLFNFCSDGYIFSEKHSTISQPVFVRSH